MIEIVFFLGGYLVQLSGTALLLNRVVQKKSVYGLSFDSQICYLVAALARSVWTVETRLTETKLAYLELLGAIVLSAAVCLLSVQYRKTTTRQAPLILSAWVLIPVAFGLAVLAHPGKGLAISQILVAFTIYLEAVALLPQIQLNKKLADNDAMTTQYVALSVLARVVRLVFWIALYSQGDKFIGLMLADLIHCAIWAQYFIMWVRNLRFGGLGLIHHL